MNNRGQTLVLFVILIPVITFLFVCFYQLGTNKIEDKRLEDSIKEALEYGVNNLDSEILHIHIKEMITSSNKDIDEEDIEIYVSNDEVNIKVKKEYSVIFIMEEEKILDYTGKKSNDNIEIIKNRG